LAVVVALAAGLQLLAARVRGRPRVYAVTAGLLCGAAGVLSMMTPVVFAPGVIYDGRAIVLALAGMFAGPVGGAIAAVVCGAYRAWLGGAGAAVGVVVVFWATALGVGFWAARQDDARWERPGRLFAFGFGLALSSLALMLLVPGLARTEMLRSVGPAVLFGYPVALVVAASVFLEGERRHRAEEDLGLALRGADLSTWMWDLATGRVQLDERGAQSLGYALDELEGTFRAYQTLVHPEDRDRLQQRFEDFVVSGKTRFESVHRVLHRDGTTRWALVRGAAIEWDAGGRPTKLRGTTLDITELRRAEQALLESAAQLEAAVRAANIGLWSWDPRTTTVYYSSQWKAQLGLRDDEVGSGFDEWSSRVHPDDLARAEAEIRSHIEAATPHYELEFRMRHAEGTYRWIRAFASTVTDDSGTVVRILGAHVDLTEERSAEDERRRLQQQLFRAQRLESVGRLAGGVAHDYNNMLSIILGHAELALETLPPESELRYDLEQIQDAGQRSAELTRQLLAFARKQRVAPVVLDLGATVDRLLEMLRRLIGEDIQLSVAVPPEADDGCFVEMDPSQVDQILVNLVVNARDAIRGPGSIRIRVDRAELDEARAEVLASDARPGRYVVLTVQDDGVGIDATVLPRLFEPFFTTKPVGTGTGLGLSTVYGIVRQNGGFILVESTPGRGSSFRVHLPQHEPGAAEDARLDGRPAVVPRGSETILVVEDEPAILKMAERQLRGLGYTVIASGSPLAALDVVREAGTSIDLLLTDVVMPNLTGRDLLASIRQTQPGVRCVFMSGYSADVMSQRGGLEEATAYLQKPFDRPTLADTVRAALDAPSDVRRPVSTSHR
jgi:PAS domain S-box-containing protein